MLGLSLGQSAVYAVVQLIDLSTRAAPLAQQTATLNPSRSSREVFDLIYQLLGNGFALIPVALVCWLLWRARPRPEELARGPLARLGLDLARPGRDLGLGAALALGVGACGIGVYLGGRALGITVAVDPAGLGTHWWTVPILLLSAARSGIEEEVVMIGYLFARLRDLGLRDWPILVVSAVIRGTYHLYQGWGSFVGNVLMGLLFGWLYTRGPSWLRGRTLPLVLAHFLIDAAVFIGYPWAASLWPTLFGLPD